MALQAPAQQLVTVFGGSGFVGRHVVRALVKRGYRVRVAVRRPDLAGFLQPLGTVGQIHAVQANLRYPASVAAAVKGADAVVNLVGIMNERGRQSFAAVQANGARTVAQACAAAGIDRLVQISALGAAAESRSAYARTKAEGESAVRHIVPRAVILRPSVMFGPEDDFFNRFASMARMMPVLPLVGDGSAKLQPAFVGDVAEVVARGVDGALEPGRTYELGGPEVMSLRELVEDVCKVIGRKRLILPLPLPLAGIMARVLEVVDTLTLGLLPNELKLTRDQVTLLGSDNVVSAAAKAEGRDFAGLGIAPVSVEVEVPSYLWRFRKTGQFDTARAS
ncbi:NADH dehydrogenase [Bosea sp. OAE752]|jgi:NADH dehydrogenase|uniref:Complex I NDUFA9 subunit family protein n=1 Tax=Bosea spartocytisi TaxID=2773451 RepID=A0A927ECD8_9HYPH|nr:MULTISPECIES: complex I NDUFA9 subunit family protein [Bosea]MBD3848342.1 complex I NDUFA9 subunit family protein [Bosea spartocytisi]MCT4474809.1 complex I NDUFA9 subunit family protein [Bosea spartocytisi]